MSSNSYIGVVDYGVGTWTSVVNMLDSIGVVGESCANPDELSRYSHVILPGVGNFSAATARLNALGWRGALQAKAASGVPILGICLGMQLLGSGSEEGEGEGLSLLDFRTEKLSNSGDFRVPNIGWNVVQRKADHAIFQGWTDDFRFYFVHGFAVPESCPDSIGTTVHNNRFTSVVAKDNIVGVQFHPEKSHKYGQRLIQNFASMEAVPK